MLGDHVTALLHQRHSSVLFFLWIIPSIHPYDIDCYVWVCSFCTQIIGVNFTNNFWDRISCDVTNFICFGHHARDHALHVPSLVQAETIIGKVGPLLKTCCMLEFHVWKFLCNVFHWVHIAKGCAENNIVALQRHLRKHALCIGAFAH